MLFPLSAVVEQLVINNLLKSDVPFLGRTMTERILMSLFAVMLGVGLLSLVYALYLYLQATQSPEMAAALAGGAAFLLAMVLGGARLAIIWFKVRKMKKMKADIESVVREILASANDEVGETIRDNPKSSAFLALILGVLVGERVF